jgi:hypothetical protein
LTHVDVLSVTAYNTLYTANETLYKAYKTLYTANETLNTAYKTRVYGHLLNCITMFKNRHNIKPYIPTYNNDSRLKYVIRSIYIYVTWMYESLPLRGIQAPADTPAV